MGQAAGFVACAAFVPYLRAVLSGRSRPNRATWWIWTAVGAILYASYRAAGGGPALWVPASFFVGPLAVALLSIRYGEGGSAALDLACLAIAAASLGVWALTRNPLLALWLNVGVDAAGALPTLQKARRDPASESLAAWVLFLAGDLLNLGAVPDWGGGAVYPVYLTVLSLAMVLLCLRPAKR